MTALRSFVASLGIASAALGVVVIIFPDTAGALGLPRLGVVLFGTLALVEAVRSLVTRRRTEINGADPPDPEVRLDTGNPGDEFDQQVVTIGRLRSPRWSGGEPERLRGRIHAAALAAVEHRWRLSPEAAHERIEAGEWTDDSAAAWFLGGPEVPRPPWRTRARAVLAPEPSAGYYANRTADAVVALREGR